MEREARRRNNKLPESFSLTDAQRKEGEMRNSFYISTEEILSNEARFAKDKGGLKIGLEIEYSIVSPNFSQSTEEIRNRIIQENEGFMDCEMGAAQLELRTDPLLLTKTGLLALEKELVQKEEGARQSALRNKVLILRSGSNPFVPIDEIRRTSKAKYQQVPDYHNYNKLHGLDTSLGEIDRVDVRDAAVVALMNSVQCNLEAMNFTDAIDKTNRSFAIGPMVVAISGNSRFLEEKDLGISDSRMIAWEVSHDTRTSDERERGAITRIGLPGIYYKNLRDYFQRVAVYPFILHDPQNAFKIGIGLNWRDTRIKFIGDSVVVEFRPVSIQPTAKEDVSVMLFYLGRLRWSQDHQEKLMDMRLIENNRNQAMRLGLKGRLWVQKEGKVLLNPTVDVLKLELKRSHQGLINLGFSKQEIDMYFDILNDRLKKTECPSDALVASYKSYIGKGYSRRGALIKSFETRGSIIG